MPAKKKKKHTKIITTSASESLLYQDELTKIPNRRYYNHHFPLLWKECKKNGEPISLLMIDIDNFKEVNDTYLHDAGDAVLKQTSAVMQDSVSGRMSLVRLAGDEFVFICPGSDAKTARQTGESLVELIRNTPFDIPGMPKEFRISISVGIATSPQHTKKQDNLLHLADQSLYLSKYQGRSQATLYNKVEVSKMAAQRGGIKLPCEDLLLKGETLDRIATFCNKDSADYSIPLLITGPIGIGKSHLFKTIETLPEFQEKFLMIYALCMPYFMHHPFKGIIQILDQIISRDPVLAKDIEPRYLERLAFLFPSLKKLLEEKGLKALPADERDLNVLTKNLLLQILEKKNILICLDELQYCDKESAAILDELCCREPDSSLFLIASITGSSHEYVLAEKMPGILAQKKYRSLVVPPLDKDGILRMLSLIFKGEKFEERILSAVSSRSQGNPLFIETMIRFMNERNLIFYTETKWQIKKDWKENTPADLDGLVFEGLKDLDPSILEILSHASLIGQNFNLKTLEVLEPTNEGEIIDFLEKAKKADLLVEEAQDREDEYTFSNEPVVNALSRMIPKEEKKDLHSQIAEIEQALGGDYLWQNLGKVLSHYKKAEKIQQASKVLEKLSLMPYSAVLSMDLEEVLSRGLPEKDWGKEEKLKDEDIVVSLEVIKHVKNALQTIRLYPKKSKLLKSSIKKVYSSITTVLKKSDTLTFSTTTEDILINGIKPSTKDYRKNFGPFFRRMMVDLGFKGVSFKKGLSQDEVNRFILLLSQKQEGIREKHEWDDLLIKENIKNIILDYRVYVAIGERDIHKVEKGVLLDSTPQPSMSQISSEDVEILKQLLQQAGTTSGEIALPEKLSEEKVVGFISLLEGVLHGREASSERAARPEEERIIPGLDQDLKVCLENLASENQDKVLQAAAYLIQAGDQVVEETVNFITRCEKLRGRRNALEVLTKIHPSHIARLVPEMKQHSVEEIPKKILSIVYDIDHPSVRDILRLGLFHPNQNVKLEALVILEDNKIEWYKEIILEYLRRGISIHSLRAIASVGKMKIVEAVPILLDYLHSRNWIRTEEDLFFHTRICETLGEINNEEALDALIKLAVSQPFWAGTSKTHTKTRLAAIRTIGVIAPGNKRAVEVLDQIIRSRNQVLSKAAQKALDPNISSPALSVS